MKPKSSDVHTKKCRRMKWSNRSNILIKVIYWHYKLFLMRGKIANTFIWWDIVEYFRKQFQIYFSIIFRHSVFFLSSFLLLFVDIFKYCCWFVLLVLLLYGFIKVVLLIIVIYNFGFFIFALTFMLFFSYFECCKMGLCCDCCYI